MARSVLLLVLLLACAAAVWLLWPADDSDPASPGDAPEIGRDAPTVPDTPQLRGAGEGASSVPVELRGRGTIVGRVSRDGVPVAAPVALYHLETFASADPLGFWRGRSFIDRLFEGGVATGEALARVQAADDGTFTFDGLRTGIYELRATGTDGRLARTTAVIPAAGARAEALLDLPSGGETLRGRVVHAQGGTVDGHVIVERGENMSPFFGPAPGATVCAVGADGTFVAAGLPPGPASVSFLQPGTLRLFGATVVLPRTEEFVITIGAGTETMHGRVLDEENKTPIEGAGVTAGAGTPGTGILLLRTTTDADGRFEVLLPPGEGGLFVNAEGYAPHTGEWSGAGAEMEIRLLRTARVSGRVVEAEGKEAVSGVWVFALPMERGFSLAFPMAGRTGASGRFELPDVAPGQVTIYAMGNGWASPGLGEAKADGYNPFAHNLAPGASQEIEIEVAPAGRIEGRIVSADGKGVAGAILNLDTQVFAMQQMRMMSIFGGGAGSAVTEADGSFIVDTVVPDVAATLKVQAVGHPAWTSDALRVGSGETKRLDVTLDAPRWVLVTVIDGDGPVAGATVRAATTEDGRSWSNVIGVWTTDAKGKARVGPLPTGTMGVRVEAPDHVEKDHYEEVLAKGAIGDAAATITLDKGLSLAGRVVAPEGVPVAGASVTVSGRAPGSGYVWERPPVSADGTWRLGGLGDASFEVEAGLTWKGRKYASKTMATAGDDAVLLNLVAEEERVDTLVVKIVDPDGNPVARGRIRVHSRTGGSRSSNAGDFSNGRASFSGDFANAEQVWIEVYEILGARWGEVVVGPLPGASGEIEVRVPPGRTIEGIVVDPDGKGVGGVRVQALRPSADDDGWTGQGASALSAADGRFEVGGLGDRAYRVRVHAASSYASTDPIEVRGGARGVRIALQEAARADVKVLDWRGEPVVGATVKAVPSKSDETPRHESGLTHTTTNRDGVARLGGLTPGVLHDLSIEPPDSRDDLRSHGFSGWDPEDITVDLARAYVIAGVVLDTAGNPLADATVQRATAAEPSTWTGVGCAPDGTFRIKDLEAGEYLLRPGLPSGPRLPGTKEESVVSVRAGTEDVVLRMDTGLVLAARIEGWPAHGWGNASLRLEGDEGREVGSVHMSPGAPLRFYRLEPGRTYTLWVVGWDSEHYVLATGLRPGTTEQKVTATRGVEVTGRLILPAGVTPRHQTVNVVVHGMTLGTRVNDDGTFAKKGLPPGTWTVNARAWGAKGRYSGSATVTAPGSVIIQLE